jgi:hypothetical protein
MGKIHRYEIYASGESKGGKARARYIVRDNREGVERRYESDIGDGTSYVAAMCSMLFPLQELNSKSNNNIWRVQVLCSNLSAVNSFRRWKSDEFGDPYKELNKFLASEVVWIPGTEMDEVFDEPLDKKNRRKRKGRSYNDFVASCLDRDNRTCQKCGSTQDICVHHIEDIKSNGESGADPSNGICLCRSCHINFHTKFMGHFNKPCARADLEAWMKTSKE